MIDIVQAVQAADPGLGTRVIVLRPDSRALATAEALVPEAEAWIAENAPGARLVRKTILLAPYPGSRTFSFRSATMAHGRLVAYAADGRPIATYDDELAAAFRAPQ